jgi:very-short-patch-repair endonuclease
MTSAEQILWGALRKSALNGLHFRRQQVIDGFVVDFYCDRAKLAVEVDGGIHRGSRDYDAERDRILTGRGVRMLRLGDEEVDGDLGAVLKKIITAAET